jgi:carboxyl-terminal processing protease
VRGFCLRPFPRLRAAARACHAKYVHYRARQFAGLILWSALVVRAPAAAQLAEARLTESQKQLQIESFETVWTTVRDKHWDLKPGGLDWDAIHREFRPKIEQVNTVDEARTVMREMLARLKQTHFAIIPSVIYKDVGSESEGDGTPGFEVRIMSGADGETRRVIVVESRVVEFGEGSPVKPGWEVLRAGSTNLRELVAQLSSDPSISSLALHRAVMLRLTGKAGATREFEFLDGANNRVRLTLRLHEPRGNLAGFGNLPPQRVWIETRKIRDGYAGHQGGTGTGYIRFNEFLDLTRVMGEFSRAVQECAKCDGIVIDLRGNPGGIGAMAMGMAGWLVDRTDLRLGTMHLRGGTLNFVINPREGAYTGPVAVLVDELSASTAEIFAGGLKDIGRARIIGSRTAGAALPSVITHLPNGDGFQYAVANYISEGGRPLEANGVTPDLEVKLTREALLAGRDPVLEAALDWIRKQKGSQ